MERLPHDCGTHADRCRQLAPHQSSNTGTACCISMLTAWQKVASRWSTWHTSSTSVSTWRLEQQKLVLFALKLAFQEFTETDVLCADVSGVCWGNGQQGDAVAAVAAAAAAGDPAQPGGARAARHGAAHPAAQACCPGHRHGRLLHGWQDAHGECWQAFPVKKSICVKGSPGSVLQAHRHERS